MEKQDFIREEISKLLYVSFQDVRGENFGGSDLARLWSLDLQWLSPKESSVLMERLCSTGWLVGDDESLDISPGVETISPTLGWRPLIGDLGKIPEPIIILREKKMENTLPSQRRTSTMAPSLIPSSENIQKKKIGPEIVSHVSKSSGLSEEEVIRRANRKRRALGPISMPIAICLLAREQGLEMSTIVELID